MAFGFGVDIGGTKCAVTLAAFAEGENQIPVIADKCNFATDSGESYEQTIKRIMDAVDALAIKH